MDLGGSILALKFRIHPLFFAAVLAYTLLGGLPAYAVAFVAVTLHELAHAAVARLVGGKELVVTLMPYGAMMSAKGVLPHFGAILIAGPLSNLIVASLTLSVCWLFPELYGGCKTFLRANLLIATVNLLPAYPLDGGRLLRLLFPREWARGVSNACTLAVGGASVVVFGMSRNLSALLFSIFMFSYFFAFCVRRVTRLSDGDPL